MNRIAIALVSPVATNDMSGTATAAGLGALFVGFAIFGFIIGLVWLFFPFVILTKLNKMIYALDILNHNVRLLAKEADERAASAGRPPAVKMGNPEIGSANAP